MPREVLADDLERFLETLDGVEAARVLTTPSGEVANVYVTASGDADSRGLRHGIVAALRSRFGLPVDTWKVHVTRLRPGAHPADIPSFRVLRVEESGAADDLAVTVHLRWKRGAEERSAAGRARGSAGPASRPRILAAAALDAVREAMDAAETQPALDGVGPVSFLGRTVVLAAISVPSPAAEDRPAGGGQRRYIGVAFDRAPRTAESEPAIVAALDAVTRWLLDTAFAGVTRRSAGRREQLDAMRHFVLDASRERGAAGERGSKSPRDGADLGALLEGTAGVGAAPREPGFDDVENGRRSAGDLRHADAKGGAAMGLQHDTPEAGSGARPARTPGVEDAFYRALIVEKTPVHLRCRDGYEISRAIIREAGTYALLLETADGLELFFKHAIISIRILPKTVPQA